MLFFFSSRRRHTRFKCDWSSDVCSSDLYTAEALKEPTARAAAERLFVGTADSLSCPGNPKGCLRGQGALACGEEADPIRKELILRRATGGGALRERFEGAKVEGGLPCGAEVGGLARYGMGVGRGLMGRAVKRWIGALG